jgi:hypothetical protein
MAEYILVHRGNSFEVGRILPWENGRTMCEKNPLLWRRTLHVTGEVGGGAG